LNPLPPTNVEKDKNCFLKAKVKVKIILEEAMKAQVEVEV